jgi:hypothetical protein
MKELRMRKSHIMAKQQAAVGRFNLELHAKDVHSTARWIDNHCAITDPRIEGWIVCIGQKPQRNFKVKPARNFKFSHAARGTNLDSPAAAGDSSS